MDDREFTAEDRFEEDEDEWDFGRGTDEWTLARIEARDDDIGM